MRKVIDEGLHCGHLLNSLGKLQQLGEIGRCPRCGHQHLDRNLMLNALSRHADVYICPSCGTEEALMAAAHKDPLPFPEWALFQSNGSGIRDTFISAEPVLRESMMAKRVYALGMLMDLDHDLPNNDCRIYLNIFNMARELDGALEIVDGYPATVLCYRLHERIRELGDMWRENHAILAYRAQHGKEGETPGPWYPGTKEKSGYAAEALTGQGRRQAPPQS